MTHRFERGRQPLPATRFEQARTLALDDIDR
jgi:hypothetical protein